MRNLLTLFLVFLLVGCAGVRPQDLDAWKGVSVTALDTHSIFLTMPMVKTTTDNGTEIRNYVNKRAVSGCNASGFGTGTANGMILSGGNVQVLSNSNFNAFQSCSANIVGCNNIFYIKNGKVLEYRPVGQCFTNESAQPEPGWERF